MQLRYERKYLVPNEMLPDLRKELLPFVRPDTFADKSAGIPEYTVRSIYFDNLSKWAVFDKIEGVRDRKKLRIRGYNKLAADSSVFLEIKRKISDQITKNRSKVRFDRLVELLTYGDIDRIFRTGTQKDRDDASRFLYHMHRYHMSPVNLVVYDREPYHGLLDASVRVTFDKHIRTRLVQAPNQLFEDSGYEYPWESHFILEIKYFHAPMPSWAKALVQKFELKNQALSKYVEGYLCHQTRKTDV
jgi:hypothetical protein